LALDPSEVQAAQDALAQLGQPYSEGEVLTSRFSPPVEGELNVYNIGGGSVNPVLMPYNSQAIVLTGSSNASIYGGASPEVLIGNAGNDFISGGGGSGSIIAGDGNNVIQTGSVSGPFYILTGTGHDTINLGSGSDTVVSEGSATVIGSTGQLFFQAGGFGNESVVGGSGDATMIGGFGNNVFIAGTGSNFMQAGAGSHDTFVGGSSTDTMGAAGAASALFEFDSAHGGGHHTISGFDSVHDTVAVFGYANGSAVITHPGGDTLISMSDGTQITLSGYSGTVNIQYH